MTLTVWVHRLTGRLPAEEKSGLAAAMRRSATAAAQRLADADGREDDTDAGKQYEAALAALRELGTAGVICRKLKYLGPGALRGLRMRIARVERRIDADLLIIADGHQAETPDANDGPGPTRIAA